jgi:hypothetical protein
LTTIARFAAVVDWWRRSAPERSNVDLAGPPSKISRRALERDNLVLAEVTAREIAQTDRGLKRLWNFGARSGIVA